MRIWNRKSVEKFVLCCRCLVCWPRCLNNTHCLYPFSGFLSGIVLLFCQAGLKCLLNGVDSIFDWTIHTQFAWFWHLGNLNCLQIIHRKNPGATLISSPIYDYMPIANEAMHWLAHWVSEWVNIMFCEWLQRSYPLPFVWWWMCVCVYAYFSAQNKLCVEFNFIVSVFWLCKWATKQHRQTKRMYLIKKKASSQCGNKCIFNFRINCVSWHASWGKTQIHRA